MVHITGLAMFQEIGTAGGYSHASHQMNFFLLALCTWGMWEELESLRLVIYCQLFNSNLALLSDWQMILHLNPRHSFVLY